VRWGCAGMTWRLPRTSCWPGAIDDESGYSLLVVLRFQSTNGTMSLSTYRAMNGSKEVMGLRKLPSRFNPAIARAAVPTNADPPPFVPQHTHPP
jgi:hypothetical protein